MRRVSSDHGRKGGPVAGKIFVECRKDLGLCSKGYSRASASRYSAGVV